MFKVYIFTMRLRWGGSSKLISYVLQFKWCIYHRLAVAKHPTTFSISATGEFSNMAFQHLRFRNTLFHNYTTNPTFHCG